MDTQGIILSGVHSWERSGFGGLICKSLVPIALRPLIWRITQWLRCGGINRASICGNSHTDYLREHLGDGLDGEMALSYVEDHMPRGPAGCVRDAGMGQCADQFVVIEGAVVPHVDLSALLETHLESGASLTVVSGVQPGSNPSNEVQEPMGIYVFSSRILQKIPACGYQDIKEKLIPDLHRMGEPVMAFPVTRDAAYRVRNADSYLKANMSEVERIVRGETLGDDYVRIADAWVHTTARVDPTARFVGPALVGADSTIGPGSLIVGPTSIGVGCRISSSAVVSRAVVWDGGTVGHGALLDHSILTTDAEVPAGEALRHAMRFSHHRLHRSPMDRLACYFRKPQKRTGALDWKYKRCPESACLGRQPRDIRSAVNNISYGPSNLGADCLGISSDMETKASC